MRLRELEARVGIERLNLRFSPDSIGYFVDFNYYFLLQTNDVLCELLAILLALGTGESPTQELPSNTILGYNVTPEQSIGGRAIMSPVQSRPLAPSGSGIKPTTCVFAATDCQRKLSVKQYALSTPPESAPTRRESVNLPERSSLN